MYCGELLSESSFSAEMPLIKSSIAFWRSPSVRLPQMRVPSPADCSPVGSAGGNAGPDTFVGNPFDELAKIVGTTDGVTDDEINSEGSPVTAAEVGGAVVNVGISVLKEGKVVVESTGSKVGISVGKPRMVVGTTTYEG